MAWLLVAILLVTAAAWAAVLRVQSNVSRVERRLNLLLRHFGIDAAAGSPLSERVRAVADDPARKIEAIKAYREEAGVGLAEAKAAVEDYLNGR